MLFYFPSGSCISERFLMKFYDANYTEYSSLALQIRSDPDWGILSLLFIPRYFPYLRLILSSYREWRVQRGRVVSRSDNGTIDFIVCPCKGGILAA